LPEDGQLARIVSSNDVNASAVLRYAYSEEGRITLTIEQANRENTGRVVNFNYEFDFSDWQKFHVQLEKVSEVASYSESMLDKLLGEI
jgi:hypothetical protein